MIAAVAWQSGFVSFTSMVRSAKLLICEWNSLKSLRWMHESWTQSGNVADIFLSTYLSDLGKQKAICQPLSLPKASPLSFYNCYCECGHMWVSRQWVPWAVLLQKKERKMLSVFCEEMFIHRIWQVICRKWTSGLQMFKTKGVWQLTSMTPPPVVTSIRLVEFCSTT